MNWKRGDKKGWLRASLLGNRAVQVKRNLWASPSPNGRRWPKGPDEGHNIRNLSLEGNGLIAFIPGLYALGLIAAITPFRANSAMVVGEYPSIESTAWLCSPKNGGGPSTMPGVSDSFTGMPSRRIGPYSG